MLLYIKNMDFDEHTCDIECYMEGSDLIEDLKLFVKDYHSS